MKKLDPEIKKKLVRYVAKEHAIDADSKVIFLKGFPELSSVDEITQQRIRMLMKKEKYKVYSQPELF